MPESPPDQGIGRKTEAVTLFQGNLIRGQRVFGPGFPPIGAIRGNLQVALNSRGSA